MLKIQRSIITQNNCDAVYDEHELVAAILWYAEKPVLRIKNVFMHGKYPAISIDGTKLHIHRLLMMYWLNTKSLERYVVHHHDGNRLNSTRENLALFPQGTHGSLHNKGKVYSGKHIKRLSEANRKRKGTRHKMRRNDVSPHDVFVLKEKGCTYNQISRQLGLDWGCVKQRHDDYLHDNPELLEVSK